MRVRWWVDLASALVRTLPRVLLIPASPARERERRMTHDGAPTMQVCQAFVARAPVDGAAFTAMLSDMSRDLLCASDAVVEAVEDLQFSLGEGPGLEAFITRRPVLIADLAGPGAAGRWPVFVAEAAELPIGALFAFPLQLGAITLGVCVGYRRRPGSLTGGQVTALLGAVDAALLSLLMLRAGDHDDEPDANWLDRQHRGRRLVHQATGMLTVQLGVGIEEAFTRLRAHAFAESRRIDDVAADIVARRLRLESDE
jgi:ANTAR domain